MKKWYAVYLVASLVACVAALLGINRIVQNTNRQIAALHTPEQVVAQPALSDEEINRRLTEIRERAEAVMAEARASAAQSARITKALEAVAIAPKPAPRTEPAHYYTPKGATASGRVYSNANLKPAPKPVARRADPAPARVIVDFKPSDANTLEWRAAVASGRCAAFSFVDASGKTVNRLYCDPVVAR